MRNDASMKGKRPAGLILTPGSSARRDHPGLVAVDHVVTDAGIAVERIEFPNQAAGKRRPDPPDVCIRDDSRRLVRSWPPASVSSGAVGAWAVAPWEDGCAQWPSPRGSRPPPSS